ncbi:MAG: spore coat protein CotJB [Candidatus Scatovivens sp.]
MENRKELLMKIMQYKFSVNDISLYLDTHPNDRNALRLHNEYVRTLKKLEESYEEKFGPLTFETEMDSWQWIEDKWPWERGYN